jgi:hypothetical protein
MANNDKDMLATGIGPISRWNYSKRYHLTNNDDTYRGVQNPPTDNKAIRQANSGILFIDCQFPQATFSLSTYPGRSGKRDISVNNWNDSTNELKFGLRPIDANINGCV